MKCIICEEPNKLILKEKKTPLRKNNEALLKINKVGICGTDFHAYNGNQPYFTYPRILGHELASEIIEIEENKRGLKIGDKVVLVPFISCDKCYACLNGNNNCCPNIKVLGVHINGGMQEKISFPIKNLLPAQNLNDNEIVIIEPLSIGAHAIKRASLKPNDTIIVLGCGPIGIGIMKIAKIIGCKVISIDLNQNRLDYVKKEIKVDFAINLNDNPIEKIEEITKGNMADSVFDATGNKSALESGPSYLCHGGKFILVGIYKGNLKFNHPYIHSKEITLLSSRNATIDDFKYVISIIDQFPTESFITNNINFTKLISNFDNLINPESRVIKATINFTKSN
ncbi:MAG: zinc-binding alcohol dehydrogenase family protein [Flavobacteriaceae bacterium]|nr:zinc-binding alcohol dehydrogenase family protein [Flavobacteriaceae bacterium]